eukprot:6704148-Prymnesium_polylepis.1
MAPAHCSLDRTVGPRHAAARQPLQVPGLVARRRRAIANEQPVERLHEGAGAHDVGGHGDLRVAREARASTL